MKDFKLSDIHPCITPDMQEFLDVMRVIAKNYMIVELNECLKTIGGNFKESLDNIVTILKREFKIEDLEYSIDKKTGKYNIEFCFMGKDVYICDIGYKN